eukprot:m.153155 g.153155  ORF g.153155 m.153155 type:complete len:239 (-) comp30834_c0_seq1:32-748(-)
MTDSNDSVPTTFSTPNTLSVKAAGQHRNLRVTQPPPAPYTPGSIPNVTAPKTIMPKKKDEPDLVRKPKTLVGAVTEFSKQNPLGMKCIVSATTGMVGELLSQRIKTGRVKFHRNTLTFMIANSMYVAPFMHNWHPFLDKRLVPTGSNYPVVQKLMWDRLICSPIFNSGYLFLLSVLNGKTPAEAMHAVRTNIVNVVTKSLQFWTIVNGVSYSKIPLELRSYFNSVMSVVWTSYLAASS